MGTCKMAKTPIILKFVIRSMALLLLGAVVSVMGSFKMI